MIVLLSIALAAELEVRDVVDNEVLVVESEHFVFVSGPDASTIDEGVADQALAALEDAWDFEVEELGLAAPRGASLSKINAYVHTSGLSWSASGAEILEMGLEGTSYYAVDPDGYAAVFFNEDHLHFEEYESVIAHELGHACQDAAQTFAFDGWFAEGTAVWLQEQFRPTSSAKSNFGLNFVQSHELPLEADYEYGQEGILHRYGTASYLQHFTDTYGDDVLLEAWKESEGLVRAVDRLDQLLVERGSSFDEAISESLVSAWMLDMPRREEMIDIYVDNLESYGLDTDPWQAVGTPLEWDASVPADLEPGLYGIAVFLSEDVAGETVQIELDGASQGSDGTLSDWVGAVVAQRDDYGFESWPVSVSGTSGLAVVDVPGDTARLWVLAMPRGAEFEEFETFPVEATIGPVDVEQEEPRACGCASAGGTAAWLGFPILLVLSTRRRRPWTGSSRCRSRR